MITERSQTFPTTPGSISEARLLVLGVLDCTDAADDTIDAAQLLVSELATNVVKHTDSDSFTINVSADGNGTVVVHVAENRAMLTASFQLRSAAADQRDTNGRGLGIVDAVARRWGISRAAQRTTAWFELWPATGLASAS